MAGNYQIGPPSKEWLSVQPAIAAALRNRASKMVSLDTPQDQDATDIGADILAGFTPGVGDIQSMRDFERARREGNKFDMGLSALGMIPFVAGGIKAVKAATKGGKVAKKVDEVSEVVSALRGKKGKELPVIDQQKLSTQYPDIAPGELRTDPKTGKQFMGKVQSAEAEAVAAHRKAAQKEIDAGNYTPYFDVSKRFDADPKNYPLSGNTLTDAMPKKAATQQKYRDMLDTPEARERLMAGYNAAKDDPLAKNWYFMGQMENKYIDELGESAGRAAFKRDFADGMAATTGGADPTSNFLTTHYLNYLRANGKAIPAAAHEHPFPIGGRYISGNVDMYDKVINQGRGLSAAEQPKRHNFSANFLGHADRATVDEQMSGGFIPGLLAPPGDSYGIMEGRLGDLGREVGTDARGFQDVTWAGLKGTKGKPMIQHINESIERTARVTGKTPEEVVRQNLIRKMGPMFGIGAVAGGAAAYGRGNDDSSQY